MDGVSVAVAGASLAVTLICAACAGKSDGWYYEFKWVHEPPSFTKVTKNVNGTIGWADVVRTTNPHVKAHSRHRMHRCAFSPCTADHAAAKYGNVGPPRHAQEVAHRPELHAAAELPSDAAGPIAVAEVPTAAELPSDAAVPVPVDVDAPADPSYVSVKTMAPPAPSSPISRPFVDPRVVAHAIGSLSPAVAAQHAVHATLLVVAREIRRPC